MKSWIILSVIIAMTTLSAQAENSATIEQQKVMEKFLADAATLSVPVFLEATTQVQAVSTTVDKQRGTESTTVISSPELSSDFEEFVKMIDLPETKRLMTSIDGESEASQFVLALAGLFVTEAFSKTESLVNTYINPESSVYDTWSEPGSVLQGHAFTITMKKSEEWQTSEKMSEEIKAPLNTLPEKAQLVEGVILCKVEAEIYRDCKFMLIAANSATLLPALPTAFSILFPPESQ